jgi:hypothetical protein
MATTKTPLSAAEIEVQLDQAHTDADKAQAALGQAALGDRGVAAAEKTLQEAQAAVTRLEAAHRAALEHEAKQTAQETADEARAGRIAAYEAVVETARRKRAVLEAEGSLRVAEGHLAALRQPNRAINRSDLDFPLLYLPTSSVGECDSQIARAKQLIEAEKAGNATEVTTTRDEYFQRRNEQRAARRAEYERTTPKEYRYLSDNQRKKKEQEAARREAEAKQTPITRRAVH